MLIGVVADARRGDMGARLADQVDADYLSIDNHRQGCTWNHRQVWQTLSQLSDGDWCLVLEEDADPVADFRDQAAAALAAAPAPIVSFYLGRGYIGDSATAALLDHADQERAHWIVAHGIILHAVALAVRGDLLTEMVANLPQKNQPIDRELSRWARRSAHQVAYSCPSLVDHRDEPSLVTQYRRAERTAWRTGTRDVWRNEMIRML